MSTNYLSSAIDTLAKTFAASVVAAIRASNLEDILTLTRGDDAPVRRGAGRPKGSSTKATEAPRLGTGTKKLANVSAITTYVKAHPGLTGETIRKVLGIERAPWSKAVAHGIEAKLLRRDGEKRSTRYWAVSP